MNVLEDRRSFLKRAAAAMAAFPLLTAACGTQVAGKKPDNTLLGRLRQNGRTGENWTGAANVPDTVAWRSVLANESDKGEPIHISGTVFKADEKTPAPNTLIYLYHTDFEGYYGRGGQHRHGRFRGWLLTDDRGRYEFRTIKAAPYPENKWAAHIHMTVTTTEQREDWIDSILFEGDRLIAPQERSLAGKRGGFNPIVKLEKRSDGSLVAWRDIRLFSV
ncbi:MAG: hypothetical protein ABI539_04405 [Acidobacteriota bacterium]